MALDLVDVFRAATLIQWGLQPRVRPIQNAEYLTLVREYMNRSEFRDVVAEMSDGLGLYVVDVSEYGMVLSPREESVFWMRASEFRQNNASSDARLLDGLVQIAIAATIFPRAQDLEDSVDRPRPPVTIEEIDDGLRAICASLKAEFAEEDPNMDDVRTGLYDAWRVYDNALSTRETKDGRQSRFATTRIIRFNLERLKEFGCFTETRTTSRKEAWQPTRRYNVLVQELAASRLFDEVMHIQNKHQQTDAALLENNETSADNGLSHDDIILPEDTWGLQWRDPDAELDDSGNIIKDVKQNSEKDTDVEKNTNRTPPFEENTNPSENKSDDGEAAYVQEDDGEAANVQEDDGEAEYVQEDDGEAEYVQEDDGEAEYVQEDDDTSQDG